MDLVATVLTGRTRRVVCFRSHCQAQASICVLFVRQQAEFRQVPRDHHPFFTGDLFDAFFGMLGWQGLFLLILSVDFFSRSTLHKPFRLLLRLFLPLTSSSIPPKDEEPTQVMSMGAIDQSNEPQILAIKAQQLEVEWEVHHRRVLLEATRVASKRELEHCEQSCRALRHVLRQQEDLRACEREMRELDNAKDQIMTLLKVGLANLGMWVRDHYFGESYQTCGWERLMPFFQLSGWVTATATEVRLDFSPFNHRGMRQDLQNLCLKVNTDGVHLPDGRLLVLSVGQQHSRRFDGPLAATG
jgi:hypothetical protein